MSLPWQQLHNIDLKADEIYREMRLIAAIRDRLSFLSQREEKTNIEKRDVQQTVIHRIAKKILLKSQRTSLENRPFKKASLFPNGKTNIAALSLLLHGAAEVLSQKRDLPWQTKSEANLSYEKADDDNHETSYYYVTDNLENSSAQTTRKVRY